MATEKPSVGILMLETQFPRILGDIGNAATWDFPVHYKIVQGGSPEKVVRNDPMLMLDDFIKAGRELVQRGCSGITTSCGFLSLMQNEVKAALGVPVATSSLMQVPMVQALLPAGQRVGVLTISKESLGAAHLAAAGADPETPIMGTEGLRSFSRDILGNSAELNLEECRQDMLDAARALLEENEGIGAIVLECTNMAPYAADIRAATGLPVYSIVSFINWFQAGLNPPRFSSVSRESGFQAG